jgi:hypothetical protein
MRSNRLALLAVLAGTTILGLTSTGVTAIGAATAPAGSLVHHHHGDGDHGGKGA